MALVKFGAILTNAVGKVGGVLFQRGIGSSQVRTSAFRYKQSLRTLSINRTASSLLSNAWRLSLSDADRSSWASFGINNPLPDCFGSPRPLSPYNAFFRQNITLVTMRLPLINPAPELAPFPSGYSYTSYTFTVGPDLLRVFYSNGGLGAPWRTFIWCTPPVAPGVTKDWERHLLLIQRRGNPGGTNISFQGRWKAFFGTLRPGMIIFFKLAVVNQDTGQIWFLHHQRGIVV